MVPGEREAAKAAINHPAHASSYLEVLPPHPCHVHQHHSRVHPGLPVVRVPSKAIIPSYSRFLVLGGHRSDLCGIKFL